MGSALALDTTDDQTGIITAQGENGTSESKAKAFDNNNNTKWLDFSSGSCRPSWIQYQYTSGIRAVVTEYTITSANDAQERDPKDWRLLGSNDGGATWVTLDTRTNSATWTARLQKKSFTFTNTTALRYLPPGYFMCQGHNCKFSAVSRNRTYRYDGAS